ncbi:MAG: electron transfer flavoprotein subunit alpha/FixB family protein [Fimbriimonas sp.]|jgi:electron transfer flavoprotein alpha subunit
MSKLLFIAFYESDLSAAPGFAKALGIDYDTFLAPSVPSDVFAKELAKIATGYSYIASPSSMKSKDALPYLAGLLDTPMVTDVIAVVSPTTFKRPIYAGSMIATVETIGNPVVITFRPNGFEKGLPVSASTVTLEFTESSNVKVVSESNRGTGRPDLGSAKIVVSGGRPLKEAATFESVIGGFADSLGAAVGATRAAVDSGIAPNELQVGQTGKVVAPDLYIAAGISGSTQHMAGIKDSKVIVAINIDANAPIFEMADLGLVGDLYTVLPQLQTELKS